MVAGVGSPNADFIAKVLGSNGFNAEWTDHIRRPDPHMIRRFDVIYGIYLHGCDRIFTLAKMLRKRTVLHFVGSDAYRLASESSVRRRLYWRGILRLADIVLYVSPHLEKMVNRRGFTLPLPIATAQFKYRELRMVPPERDVLYYCPSGAINEKIYRLDWIIEYARTHPEEKITIIGNSSHPATYKIRYPNVEVIPHVDQSQMPLLYRRHKRLIRMTTEDGLPRMIHEALLCGIEAVHNGREIRELPMELEPVAFAERFRKILEGANY